MCHTEDITAAAPTAPAAWRYWPAMRRATAPSRSGTNVAAKRRLPDARAPLRFISDRTRFTPRAAAIGARLLRGTPSGCQKSLSEGLSPGRLSQSHGQGCYSQRLPLPTSQTGKRLGGCRPPQQFRQLGDIGRNAPRFVFSEQISYGSASRARSDHGIVSG